MLQDDVLLAQLSQTVLSMSKMTGGFQSTQDFIKTVLTNEEVFSKALATYGYKLEVSIQTLQGDTVDGEYRRTSTVDFDANGQRRDRAVLVRSRAPHMTVRGHGKIFAAALRPVQDVQMMPPGDLALTPGDTLAPALWEAWYPSAVLRQRDSDSRHRELAALAADLKLVASVL